MWPFATRAPEKEPLEPPVIDRQADLLEQLGVVDSRLRILNHDALEFRTRHGLTVDRLGRITRMQVESLAGWASVECQWRVLQREADRLLERRNKLLGEWGGLKMAAQSTGGVA